VPIAVGRGRHDACQQSKKSLIQRLKFQVTAAINTLMWSPMTFLRQFLARRKSGFEMADDRQLCRINRKKEMRKKDLPENWKKSGTKHTRHPQGRFRI
jgi:transposase